MRKNSLMVLAAVLFTITTGITSFASGWQRNEIGWWWQNDDGTYPANRWMWLDGNRDRIAEHYYFDKDGYMLESTVTPDGYKVNADGAWIESGEVQTRELDENGNVIIYLEYNTNPANDFEYGNWGMMSGEEIEAVNDFILNDFLPNHINENMTPFEKEMEIIQYLVENCEYESTSADWSRSTAYSALIEKKAQCSGYADAFLQLAKVCGLRARYIHNDSHSWNLVNLAGEWYHVDVTWEDPIGYNNYGYGNLRNKYINLTDEEISQARSHGTWNNYSLKAEGTEYDSHAVDEYLNR